MSRMGDTPLHRGAVQSAIGTPLTIDLRQEVPEPLAVNLGQGTATDPAGHTVNADSRCFMLDGKPWVPIVGEFHYARYPPPNGAMNC